MKNKKIGINVMLFGLIFCALLYYTHKRKKKLSQNKSGTQL